jgi:hypothetical protein
MVLGDASDVERALGTFGAVLEHRGDRHEVVLVGGSALMLLGLTEVSDEEV